MVQNASRLYLTQNRVDVSSPVAVIQKSGEKTLAESPAAPLMNLFVAIQMKSGHESACQDWTKDDYVRDLYQCCLKLIPSLQAELKENGKLDGKDIEMLNAGMGLSDAGEVSPPLTENELGRIADAIEKTLQQMVNSREGNDGQPEELIKLQEKYTEEFLSNDLGIEGDVKNAELAGLEKKLLKLFPEQSVEGLAADGLGAGKSEELYYQAVEEFNARFKDEQLGWKTFQIKGHSPEKPELDRAGLNSIKDDLGAIYEKLPGVLQPIANELQLLQQSLVKMADSSQAVLGKQQDVDEATKTRHSVKQLNEVITAMKAAVTGLTQAKEMLITKEKKNPMAKKLLGTINEIKNAAKMAEARAYEVLSLPGPAGLDYLNIKEDMKELQKYFGKSTPHILIANGTAEATDLLAGIVGQLKKIANYASHLDKITGKIEASQKRVAENRAFVRALDGSLLPKDWNTAKEMLRIDNNDPFFKGVARGVNQVSAGFRKVGGKVENKIKHGIDVLRFALSDSERVPKPKSHYYKAPSRADEFFQPILDAMRVFVGEEKRHAKSPTPALNTPRAPQEQQGDALIRMLRGEFLPGVAKPVFSAAALEIQSTTEKLARVTNDLKEVVKQAEKSKNYPSDMYRGACEKARNFAQKVGQTLKEQVQERLTLLPEPETAHQNITTHEFKESLTSAAEMLSHTAVELEKAALLGNKKDQLKALKVISENAEIIKTKIKDTVKSATGEKLHNFDIDGRLGKAVGMWASEQVEQYSKAHPEVPPEIIEQAMDHVFNENLKQSFGRTNDPNAVLLRNRVVQAINDIEDGNLSLPDKIKKELDRTDTFGKYLQEWGLKKMANGAAAGVIASAVDLGFSSIDGLVNHILDRIISTEGRNNLDMPRPSWLKAAIAPITITLGIRALQNSAMPNQGQPVEAIKSYLKREVPKAVFRLVTSFLPRGVNLAMAAPLAIWAVADKDRMEHLKKLATKFPLEAAFSSAYVAAVACQKWDSISAPQARAYQGKDDAVEKQVSQSADIVRRGRGGPDGMRLSEEAAIDSALSEALEQLEQEKEKLNNLTPKQRELIRKMGRTPEGLQDQCEAQIKKIRSYMKGGENENQLVILGPAKKGQSNFDACVQRGDSHQRIFIRVGANDLTHTLRHELVHLVGTEEQETRKLMALLDSLRTGRPVSLNGDIEARDSSSGLSFASFGRQRSSSRLRAPVTEFLERQIKKQEAERKEQNELEQEQRLRQQHSTPQRRNPTSPKPSLVELTKEYDARYTAADGSREVTKDQARDFYTQLADGLKRSTKMTEQEIRVVDDIYRRAYPHEMNIHKLSWNALSEILKEKGVNDITPDTIVDITVKTITADGIFGPAQPMKVKLLDLARGAYVHDTGDGHVSVVTDLPSSIKNLFHTTPYVGRQTFEITSMLNEKVHRKLCEMDENESVVFREQIWKGTVKNTLRRIGGEKNIQILKDAADGKIKTGTFTLKHSSGDIKVAGIVAIPKGEGKQMLVNILTGKTLEVKPNKNYGLRDQKSNASIKKDAEALKAFLLPNFNLNKNKIFTETDKDAYAFSATRHEGVLSKAVMAGETTRPTFYESKYKIDSVDSLDQLAEQFSAIEASDAKDNANFLFTTEGEVWAKSLIGLGKRLVNGVAMATLPVSSMAGVAAMNIGLTLLSHGLSALEISVEDDDTKRAELKTDLALDIVLSLPGDAGDVLDVINRFKKMKQGIGGVLGGGTNDPSWHNSRPPMGVNGNPPIPSNIGKNKYDQPLNIRRPVQQNGQWVGPQGMQQRFDHAEGVNVDLSNVKIELNGPNQGTYLKDGKTYIQQDEAVYEVVRDDSYSTWRIRKPDGEYGTPVHYDANTGWIPGGQRVDTGDNQWIGPHGTLPEFDSAMGVNVDLSNVKIERTGPNQGTYLKDGKTYIQQDNIVYEVRWDDNYATWQIQKPGGGYGTPVHYDANTGWIPVGQKVDTGDNQWFGPHGTLPEFDSAMGVNVNLTDVKIERTGPNQGTYLKDGKNYIQQDDIVYEVRWDDSYSTWRIQKPDGGHATPVRFDSDTGWVRSGPVVDGSTGLRPSVSGVVNGQARRIEYDLNEQELYERRAQVFEKVENGQGAEVRLTTSMTNGKVVYNQVMDALNKNPNGTVYVLTGTHGSPNGVRDRTLDAEMRFTLEDTRNLPPEAKNRVVVVDLAHSTDAYVQDLLRNAKKGDAIIGGFCFSRNDNVIRWALGLDMKPSHVPKHLEQSRGWLSSIPMDQYGPTWGTMARVGGVPRASSAAEYFELTGTVNLDAGKRYIFQIGDTGGKNWKLFDKYAKSSMAEHGIPPENVFGELSATQSTSILNTPQSNTLSNLTLNDRLDIPVHGSITGPYDPGAQGVGGSQHFSPKQLAQKLQSYGLKEVGVLRLDSCNVGDGDYLVMLKKELDLLNIKVGYLSAPNGYLQATHLPFLHIRPVWQTKFWNPWNVVEGNAKVDFKRAKYSANPSRGVNENASTSAKGAKIDFGTLNYSEKAGYLTQRVMDSDRGKRVIEKYGRIGAWRMVRVCVSMELFKNQSAESMDGEARVKGVLKGLNMKQYFGWDDDYLADSEPEHGFEYTSLQTESFLDVFNKFKQENPGMTLEQFSKNNKDILERVNWDVETLLPERVTYSIPGDGPMVPGGEYQSKPGDNFYKVRAEFKRLYPNASYYDMAQFSLCNAEILRAYQGDEVPAGTVFKIPLLTQQPQPQPQSSQS